MHIIPKQKKWKTRNSTLRAPLKKLIQSYTFIRYRAGHRVQVRTQLGKGRRRGIEKKKKEKKFDKFTTEHRPTYFFIYVFSFVN